MEAFLIINNTNINYYICLLYTSFPTSGGILKTMDLDELKDYTFLTVDGIENCINAIEDILNGNIHKCFIEMSACAGSCIGGPAMDKNHRMPIRDYVAISKYAEKDDFNVASISEKIIKKEFETLEERRIMVSDSAIEEVLREMGKTKPEDELNCGSCGYNTCREKAMAVLQGLSLIHISIFIPGAKTVETPWAFVAAIAIIELIFIINMLRHKGQNNYRADLMILLWAVLLIWEIVVTKLDLLHPVLVPSAENVFNVFATQYGVLLTGILSSLELLLIGTILGIGLGVFLGLIVGWIPRLRHLFYPIAQVLTPIPPIVYAPYLVALMPSFRSASALIIFLGIFFPTFLNMIIRVGSIEKELLESAKAMALTNWQMVTQILLPYVFPSVISGLKVTLTTSIMLLIFAEMMGATSGMGYYIINYTHYANYTNVVAGIILVGIVVTILNVLVTKIQKHAIKSVSYTHLDVYKRQVMP